MHSLSPATPKESSRQAFMTLNHGSLAHVHTPYRFHKAKESVVKNSSLEGNLQSQPLEVLILSLSISCLKSSGPF